MTYLQAERLRTSVLSHAVQLGSAVRAEDVILVRHSADAIEIVRINVKRRQLVVAVRAPAHVLNAASSKSLSQALDALAQGRFEGVPADHYALSEASKPDLKIARDTSAPQPHEPDRGAGKPLQPVYKKWWLWTTVGLVIAGGVTAGLVLGLRGHSGARSTEPTIDVPPPNASLRQETP